MAALRERAALSGRSMQKELLDILKRAAAQPIGAREAAPIELTTTRTTDVGTGEWRREVIYDDDR